MVINQFRERFLEETFPRAATVNLAKIAAKRSAKKQTDPDEELERVEKEFENLGALAFSFDSATPAAVKQMRHKLLMADAGSVNMEIDEIGSNLLGQTDVLNVFLELYDVGKVKPKLIKNTTDNVRNEDIEGKTPANLMLFGTPGKLLDGGKTEEAFLSFLETGYGRRCIFGYVREAVKSAELTPQQIFDQLTDTSTDTFLQDLSDELSTLAGYHNFSQVLTVSKDVTLVLIEYRQLCEKTAAALADHEEIRKAEVAHRYFKVLKLAGTYAFIDGCDKVTEDHLYSAIKLVEESGDALKRILTRERNYVKLAKYIAEIGREVTHVDLTEDLPLYKGAAQAKAELLTLATAWGYKNNIIIKKTFNDGIEFLKGESLQKTDIEHMYVSYGTHMAYNYLSEEVPFDQLYKMTQVPNIHWVAHKLLDGDTGAGHRQEDNCIPGFNMAVVDVDGGCSLSTARLLLKDYKCLFYTTKRHREDNQDRFRIVFPMNYTLKMDTQDYKEFMSNIYEWLPFKVDEQTNQRARKWLACKGQHHYNDGELLDALLFIPKTTKVEERKRVINDQQSLSNVERWFLNGMSKASGRNNQLIKYALMLVDAGLSLEDIQYRVLALNNKIPDKLEEVEILSTVMITVSNHIAKRK